MEQFVPLFEDYRETLDRVQEPGGHYYNKPSYGKQNFGKDWEDASIQWVYDDGADAWILHVRGNVTGAMLDRWKKKNPKPTDPPSNPDPPVNEGVKKEHMYVYQVTARDPEQNLKKLIEYIGKNGNTGHSFEIVVDPDMTEKEGRKTFYWDGDGLDYVHKVEIIPPGTGEGIKTHISEVKLRKTHIKSPHP